MFAAAGRLAGQNPAYRTAPAFSSEMGDRMTKRLGGERLPQGLRPRAFPRYLRAYAVLVGLLGAFVLVVGVGSLLSAFLW